MKNIIEIKERPFVLKAFRKPNTETYYQYRVNGKRATYAEYSKYIKISLYNEPYVNRYTTFTRKGNAVEVVKF